MGDISIIEYMNTFANYGTLACLLWLVAELRDIRRRDAQANLAQQLIEAVSLLSRHYEVQKKIESDTEKTD